MAFNLNKLNEINNNRLARENEDDNIIEKLSQDIMWRFSTYIESEKFEDSLQEILERGFEDSNIVTGYIETIISEDNKDNLCYGYTIATIKPYEEFKKEYNDGYSNLNTNYEETFIREIDSIINFFTDKFTTRIQELGLHIETCETIKSARRYEISYTTNFILSLR